MFPRIPRKYGDDLQFIIGLMLKVSPEDRPDCQRLLDQIEELRPGVGEGELDWDQYDLPDSNNNLMLNTITLPKDLKMLDMNLPRSNYGNKKRIESGLYSSNEPKAAPIRISRIA